MYKKHLLKKIVAVGCCMAILLTGCSGASSIKEGSNATESLNKTDKDEAEESRKDESIAGNKVEFSEGLIATPIEYEEGEAFPGVDATDNTKIDVVADEAIDALVKEEVVATEDNPLIANEGLTYESVYDISQEQLNEVTAIIIEAVKALDIETIKKYTANSDEANSYIEKIEQIRNDEDSLKLWDNTIGKLIYLKESNVLVGKSLNYIYSQWYTDCAVNGINITSLSSRDMSLDNAVAIYNSYYKNAPYEVVSVSSYNLNYQLVDGRLVCSPYYVFTSLGYPDMNSVFNDIAEGSYMDYASLVIGKENNISGVYSEFLNKDLNAVVEATTLTEEQSVGEYFEFYNNYLLNEENRTIIQDYMKSSVVVLRDDVAVCMFIQEDIDKIGLSEADLKVLQDSKITVARYFNFCDYPNYFDSAMVGFRYIADKLIAGEILK